MSYEIDLSGLDPEQRERWRGRLEHLPPGIRDSLAKNLQRIPPDKVARILRENEGTISRLEGKLGGAAQKAGRAIERVQEAAPRSKPQMFGDEGHYNHTVQRGDDHGLSFVALFGLALVFAGAVGWVLGAFNG